MTQTLAANARDAANDVRITRWVATIAGLVGFVLSVLTPLLPVEQTTATLNWPQAGQLNNVTAPLISQAPVSLTATVPCEVIRSMPPAGGMVLGLAPQKGKEAALNSLFVNVNAERVDITDLYSLPVPVQGADLRLWLVDGSSSELPGLPDEVGEGDICLITKRDLPTGPAGAWAAEVARRMDIPSAEITAKGPSDVAWIRQLLSERVTEALGGSEPPAATRLRHKELLTEAADRLRDALRQDEQLELAAEDVRLAARALDRITGRIDPEAVLGRIFSTFCIGK